MLWPSIIFLLSFRNLIADPPVDYYLLVNQVFTALETSLT